MAVNNYHCTNCICRSRVCFDCPLCLKTPRVVSYCKSSYWWRCLCAVEQWRRYNRARQVKWPFRRSGWASGECRAGSGWRAVLMTTDQPCTHALIAMTCLFWRPGAATGAETFRKNRRITLPKQQNALRTPMNFYRRRASYARVLAVVLCLCLHTHTLHT